MPTTYCATARMAYGHVWLPMEFSSEIARLSACRARREWRCRTRTASIAYPSPWKPAPHEGRTDGVRHLERCRKECGGDGAVPTARPTRYPGSAVQGSEHVQQLLRDCLWSRDRSGPGCPGHGGPSRARGLDEPDPAQADVGSEEPGDP